MGSAERQEQAQVAALDMTFAELCRAYSAFHYDGSDLQLRKWIDAFGDRVAWTITTEELERGLVAMLAGGYAPATLNRNSSQIGSVYKWAKGQRIAPPGFHSPTKALPRYDEAIRRVELSAAEVTRLIDGANAVKDRRFAALVRLLIDTGARRGEILQRRWRDFDMKQREITADQTKTGVPRILYFQPETAAFMQRVKWPSMEPDALPFESVQGSGILKTFKKNWRALTLAIGRPDLRMHDLRHHKAKTLIDGGVSVGTAAQVLGHSSLILHRRYGHLERAMLREASEKSWTK